MESLSKQVKVDYVVTEEDIGTVLIIIERRSVFVLPYNVGKTTNDMLEDHRRVEEFCK